MSDDEHGETIHSEDCVRQKALMQQAAALESALPRIMRRTFTLPINDPGAELPVAQMRTCSFLLYAGATPVTELADELGISVSAATQISDRLEKTGYVERVADSCDRRVKLISLTQHGKDLMQQRRDRRVHRLAEVLGMMAPETRDELLGSVGALLDASLSLPANSPGTPPTSLPGDAGFDEKPG